MTREPTTVSTSASLSDAVALMEKGGFRHLPVVSNGSPIGLLSQNDILRFSYSTAFGLSNAEQWQFLDSVADVESVMSQGIPRVSISSSISHAAQLLVEEPTGALLVLTHGGRRLEGIVTERDFIALLRKELHDYWNPDQAFNHRKPNHAH